MKDPLRSKSKQGKGQRGTGRALQAGGNHQAGREETLCIGGYQIAQPDGKTGPWTRMAGQKGARTGESRV